MANLKCKMCGGELNILENCTVCECEYCGSKQTVPIIDNEKKAKLYERANHLRASCDFDRAIGVFESIVVEYPNEAEAYFGLLLCKYGIEYVDDPKTGKKVPTCHRSSYDSVLNDANYKNAVKYADDVAKGLYISEAETIENIRKGIIEISSKEEPYDIFICYKETDEKGDRTKDSVIAEEIYSKLTEKGYKVFFSRITLENMLGVKYEPYIFSALHTSKIMLVVTTRAEYVNSTWVKNEWSRYLKLIEAGENKSIIPCYRDVSIYDLPDEFADLQGQDMSKIGAIMDLLRGIEKLISKDNSQKKKDETSTVYAPLLERAKIFLEAANFEKADEYFEKTLDLAPKNEDALLGKLLCQYKKKSLKELGQDVEYFKGTENYLYLYNVCSAALKTEIDNTLNQIFDNMVAEIKNLLHLKKFEEAETLANKVLKIDSENETALLAKLLVECRSSTINEMVGRKKKFQESERFKVLIKSCSQELKNELSSGIKRVGELLREEAYKKYEKAKNERNFNAIIDACNSIKGFDGENEEILLSLFLAENKSLSISELSRTDAPMNKKVSYRRLMEICSEETKKQISDAEAEIGKNILVKIKSLVAKKNFKEAEIWKKTYRLNYSANDEILLYSMLMELEVTSFEEARKKYIDFDKSEGFKEIVEKGSAELKKKFVDLKNKKKRRAKMAHVRASIFHWIISIAVIAPFAFIIFLAIGYIYDDFANAHQFEKFLNANNIPHPDWIIKGVLVVPLWIGAAYYGIASAVYQIHKNVINNRIRRHRKIRVIIMIVLACIEAVASFFMVS